MEIPYTFAGLPRPRRGEARVAVLPVAYDSTTSWRPGARFGPAEIIMASRFLEMYDEQLGRESCRLGIATMPEVWPDLGSPGRALAEVEKKVTALLRRGLFPVILGGEHSIAAAAAHAFQRRDPDISILVLDAHADLREDYQGTRCSHACASRMCLDLGLPVTIMGVRSFPREDLAILPGGNRAGAYPKLNLVPASRLRRRRDWLAEISAGLAEKVYLSIDLDFFDPAAVPAVGTPEPGGFDWVETVAFLEKLAARHRVLGFDITELDGGAHHHASAYLAARLAYRLIGLCAGTPALFDAGTGTILK